MALNVANWTDRQLDELADLLRTGNYSAVATFIAENFLGTGSKIMTDPSQTTLRATVGSDPKTIVLSAGVFLHAGLVSELDTDQIVNVLDTSTGAWGSGTAADLTNPRWDIIQVKNNEQLHTPASRWFVNDGVVPNTYYQQLVNTLINKAYYDITVKAGTPNPVPVVPNSDPGYWTIAEIYIPALAGTILPANVHDTATSPLPPTYDSQHIPPNWTDISRIARLEFWSTLFGADHSLVDGHHREGVWHIGTDIVTSTAAELNKLHLSGGTVTPASLKKLTDTSSLGIGELHSHGSGSMNTVFFPTPFMLASSGTVGWSNFDMTPYVPTGTKGVILSAILYKAQGGADSYLEFRAYGSAVVGVPPNAGFYAQYGLYSSHSVNVQWYSHGSGTLIVPINSSNLIFQYRIVGNATGYFGCIGYFI